VLKFGFSAAHLDKFRLGKVNCAACIWALVRDLSSIYRMFHKNCISWNKFKQTNVNSINYIPLRYVESKRGGTESQTQLRLYQFYFLLLVSASVRSCNLTLKNA